MRVNLNFFLKESTIHGIKYLSSENAFLDRLIWVFVVATSFTISGYLIATTMEEWETHPLMTTLESIDAPLKEIQFPTVTICQEEKSPVDPWSLPEKLLNMVESTCDPDLPSKAMTCPSAIKLNREFRPFWIQMLDRMDSLIEENLSKELLESFYNNKVTGCKPQKLCSYSKMRLGLSLNQSTIENMESLLLESIGQFRSLSQFLMWSFNRTSEELTDNEIALASTLPELDKSALKFMLKVELFRNQYYVGMGSLLRQFDFFLGRTFTTEKFKSSHHPCLRLTDLERQIHGMSSDIATYLGLGNHNIDENPTLSLWDIPKLFNVRHSSIFESTDEVPLYTECVFTNSSKMRSCHGRWRTFFSGKTLKPCKREGGNAFNKSCCNYATNLAGANLTGIMKVMVMANHLGQGILSETFWKQVVNNTWKYTVTPTYQWKKDYFSQNIIAMNYTRSLDKPRLVPTSAGMCLAYNARGLSVSLKKSAYMKAFQDGLAQPPRDLKLAEIPSITLYLDKMADFHQKDNKFTFRVSFNPWRDFFDVDFKSTTVPRGVKTVFSVRATVIETDPTKIQQSVSIQRRQCRFPDEIPDSMHMFQYYTKAACQFECMIMHSWNICGCVNWDMPYPGMDHADICDADAAVCFATMMQNVTHRNHGCDCDGDCNTIQYSFTEKQVEINLDQECFPKRDNFFQYGLYKSRSRLLGLYNAHHILSKGGQDILGIRNLKSETIADFCKEQLLSNIAILEIKFAANTYTKMRRELRATLGDKIGVIGGNLGLFSGLSFLGLFELLFWMAKLLASTFNENRSSKEWKTRKTRGHLKE